MWWIGPNVDNFLRAERLTGKALKFEIAIERASERERGRAMLDAAVIILVSA